MIALAPADNFGLMSKMFVWFTHFDSLLECTSDFEKKFKEKYGQSI